MPTNCTYQGLLIEHFAEWRGAMVDPTVKGTLKPPVLTRKVNIPAFMCFSVFVFVCLFVSVFELTRVDSVQVCFRTTNVNS